MYNKCMQSFICKTPQKIAFGKPFFLLGFFLVNLLFFPNSNPEKISRKLHNKKLLVTSLHDHKLFTHTMFIVLHSVIDDIFSWS